MIYICLWGKALDSSRAFQILWVKSENPVLQDCFDLNRCSTPAHRVRNLFNLNHIGRIKSRHDSGWLVNSYQLENAWSLDIWTMIPLTIHPHHPTLAASLENVHRTWSLRALSRKEGARTAPPAAKELTMSGYHMFRQRGALKSCLLIYKPPLSMAITIINHTEIRVDVHKLSYRFGGPTL